MRSSSMLCSRKAVRATARAVVDPLVKMVAKEMDREAIHRSRKNKFIWNGISWCGNEPGHNLAANNGKKPEGYVSAYEKAKKAWQETPIKKTNTTIARAIHT